MNREACLKFIKDEFKYTERFIEPLRKELNAIIKEAARNRERENFEKIKERFSKKPKELTEQEKQEALTYLQSPNLMGKMVNGVGPR